MEAFVDTDTYLKYGRRPPGAANKVQAVLWPVFIHRILYPEVDQAKMNLFEKVVLRLMRAKTHDAADIASLTGLHVDLIKRIQEQLRDRGWINDRATELTDSGLKAINGEDEQSEQLASGYLFQDALTGKLWPRIEKRLAVMEPDNPGEKWPAFAQERKTGRLLKPFKPNIRPVAHPLPTTNAALVAWQDYRIDYRAARQLYSASQIPEQVKMSGLRFLSETPETAWILLWITPSNDGQLWSIKDPFDIRDEAWWLRDALPMLLGADKHLTKKLGALIGQPEPESQTVSEWLASLRDQAQLQVMLEYPWAQKEPDIAAAISVVITRRETLESGQREKHDLEAAITDSQKLLEVLMQWLIKAFPAHRGALPKFQSNNQELNRQLLIALGLPAFTGEVIEIVSRQSLQQAINSLNKPTNSLKCLVFAAALGAVGNESHPLVSLNRQQLELDKLFDLADLRNPASHGTSRFTGKKYKEITIEIAQANIEYALQFTEQFKEWINGEAE
jgi:hypothetical protein